MKRDAVLSECESYRYRLGRTWDEDGRQLVVIGLNPSTADALEDDPTIRRCCGFAKSWGYGGIQMLNLFAWRSTKPQALRAVVDPVGPENLAWIRISVRRHGGPLLVAWGAHGELLGKRPVREVLDAVHPEPLWCLGTTKAGHPRHPLYVRGDMQPRAWRWDGGRG